MFIVQCKLTIFFCAIVNIYNHASEKIEEIHFFVTLYNVYMFHFMIELIGCSNRSSKLNRRT